MSPKMLQPDILSQSPGFYTATLPRSVVSFSIQVTQQSGADSLLIVRDRHFEFTKLPLEILILLLGVMAAEQLPLFRCLCKAFHKIVTENEAAIVLAALKNDWYRTASKLYYRHIYYPRPPPNTLHLNDLYRLARLCDSARNLAFLIAQNEIIDLIRDSEHTSITPDQDCSVTQIAANLYPYIVTLFHFLGNFRISLASFIPDPHVAYSYTIFARRPSSHIERQLLAQYNKETVFQLCSLYYILLEIVEGKLPREDITTLPFRSFDFNYLQILVFAGLEAVRDVIAKGSISTRVRYIRSHYDQTMVVPDTSSHRDLVPLPKSILPRLDHQMTSHLCRRLPLAEDLLNLENAGGWGYPGEIDEDAEEGKFLEYLATHDGAEPRLVV